MHCNERTDEQMYSGDKHNDIPKIEIKIDWYKILVFTNQQWYIQLKFVFK